MNRAALDPGSRWIAVTVTRDDGPANPCNFLDALAIEVGRVVHYDPPKTRMRRAKVDAAGNVIKPAEPYTVDHEHIATQDDRDVAADRLAEYLIRWGVEACDVETVDRAYGETAQASSKASEYLIAARETVTRALTLWAVSRTSRGLKAPRVPILATTWRARVVPLIKALLVRAGKPVKGVLIKGKGAALEPLLVEHVPGWPGGARWSAEEVEHIRDSTGLALACGLPALPARAKGSQGPRVRKRRDPSKARPRGSRARAAMGEIDREKHRATDRARYARTIGADAAEARAATGCACKPPGAPKTGRHKRDCPAHKPRWPAMCPG